MGQGFHIENFGCRAARADGEAVGARLRAIGFSEGQPAAADVVIVNTCSVTAEADRAARAYIRRIHRLNPAARILVTGCYAQRAPEELAAMAGVAGVVGNSHKALAPEIAAQLGGEASAAFVPLSSLAAPAGERARIWVDDRFAHSFLEEAQLVPGEQTRPNLKIQEGCGNRCTFCVIPETRGPSRSLAAGAVLQQIRGFVEAGGNELVLSGINLGRWGRDLAGESESTAVSVAGNSSRRLWSPTLATKENRKDGVRDLAGMSDVDGVPHPRRAFAPRVGSLAGLVRLILEETMLPRLRLSSVEPMDWNADLIALMREYGGARLARHAHLPLQSGSDTVLRRMHRRYRPWHYAEKVAALVDAAGADLTLGADVMVGFPGETEHEFTETLNFVRSLPFGYLHLFPFSPRPGTRGWDLHAAFPVPSCVVEERMSALRELDREKRRSHRSRFLGRTLDAITLHTTPELHALGRTSALTENFLPTELEGAFEANRLISVLISDLDPNMSLVGVVN